MLKLITALCLALVCLLTTPFKLCATDYLASPAIPSDQSLVVDNLYKVFVTSEEEAAILASAAIDPIVRVRDGYLILADSDSIDKLNRSGLQVTLIASGVRRGNLAMDGRRDRANVELHQLLFEEDALRLYLVDSSSLVSDLSFSSLVQIGRAAAMIRYQKPGQVMHPSALS